MAYLEWRKDGSYGEIPTNGLTLVDGRGGVEGRKAVITVREDPLFFQYVEVIRPGSDFVINRARDGVVPPGDKVCHVRRQDVTVTHEPTGKATKLVYARDY